MVKSVLLIYYGSGCISNSNCSFHSMGVQPFYDKVPSQLWPQEIVKHVHFKKRPVPVVHPVPVHCICFLLLNISSFQSDPGCQNVHGNKCLT
jgi:hypothetical protein